ncbi:putative mediator of RNA polymerase II transcription subunit 24 [Heracleum sosnowskyi]|uniref:Mediator of RNA polymerase II transcription subunit 24 n=1 Tax=Heracleum sosnowskyi TaxID=360622 RepID=A0AAD8IIN8_9APIA|nr:putative mediator of RNA polymerase II transcription subunit 24 [Heracleum sosnowskyi]
MGFFLIFFPEEEEEDEINNKKLKPSITFNTLLRRTSSVHLVSKAQSTISICALLVFFSLLLFTLSTFEPTATPSFPRRQLSSIKLYKPMNKPRPNLRPIESVHAFQGMGSLYTRGSKGMNSLIICHVMDTVAVNELGLFLRLVLRSSLTSRSDLLFVFPTGKSNIYDYVVRQENDSFLELITRFKELNESSELGASFDVTQFVKSSEKMKGSVETIWGRKIRSGNFSGENETELTQLSYGSVVGFEVDELDPENSLAGFMDHVPLSLRRWACYTLLLGRLRRKFKHVMLVDVKDVLLLGDPLGRVKNQSPESVYFSTTAKHGRKNNHQKDVITPSIISGGARGIRRLANSMVTEIVRVAMQHKRKNSVTDSVVLNQLVGNELLTSNIKVVVSSESIPEASSLGSVVLSDHSVVRRGNSNFEDIRVALMKHICSFKLESSVYSSDC